MGLKILADENIHFDIVRQLRNHSFQVISVCENYSGISDIEVMEKCIETDALLLTEDSDFGEWVFAHHKQNRGVIFLRYKYDQVALIIEKLILVLQKYHKELNGKFTVITPKKLRMRRL